MVNSLRKVDFSHPTGHHTWKKIRPPPPLEKILGAPLIASEISLSTIESNATEPTPQCREFPHSID